ncbi:sensor histidine kinase [Gallaecimonas mangrovi]|uniref:sensor histidine kinase n=1 Tax=Gallaecimonas mangrovi TaxID=2291597 RepID=UPI000E20100B|nr:ATP-binding protein [Gallaecimonas mangrovi]
MSIEGKLAAVLALSLFLLVTLAGFLLHLGVGVWLALQIALLVALTCGLAFGRLFTRRLNRGLDALTTGLLNFKDNDFSVSLTRSGNDELAKLAALYNDAAQKLRGERAHIYQRELMLDTVLQSSPVAMLLCNQNQHILYANPAARQLLADGHAINGLLLPELQQQLPQAIKDALEAGQDGLFTLDSGAEPQIWHLSHSHFQLNSQRHQLYLFKQLTRELNRAEVSTWKKVIRVISHELNNSLAPIASMAHSGQQLVNKPDPALLTQIFDTISERANHLSQFLHGYARFARLPQPQCQAIDWRELLQKLSGVVEFRLRQTLPESPGWGDPAQLSQVLVNLLKNAIEAGSQAKEIELAIHSQPGWHCLEVVDRGSGMNEQVLTQALLPFYSTKKEGTGLGLALCREIIDAHGGRLHLENRPSGGLRVRIWLPLAAKV